MAAAIEGPLIDYVQRLPSLLVGALAPSVLLPGRDEPLPIELPHVQQDTATAQRLLRCYYRLGALNVQKYVRSVGGYPHWHSEIYPTPNGGSDKLDRVLFWILYLNDVETGGETEFLYQGVRVNARAGRLLVAPAGFTHTHRGNVPLSSDKYVVSSWLCYRRFTEINRAAAAAAPGALPISRRERGK